MENITESPYLLKVVLTILAVIVKFGIDAITKEKEDAIRAALEHFAMI